MNSFTTLKTVIRTKDFQASCAFYKDILGLRVVTSWHESQDRGCIFELAENARIEISKIDPAHQYYQSLFSEEATLKIDLQLATNDLQGWAKRLKEKWECRGPVDRPWGSKYLYLKDPDGVQIIIYDKE